MQTSVWVIASQSPQGLIFYIYLVYLNSNSVISVSVNELNHRKE